MAMEKQSLTPKPKSCLKTFRINYVRTFKSVKFNKAILPKNYLDIKLFYTLIKLWPFLFCIWLTMFSTTIIFPKFQHKIKQSFTPNFILPANIFTDITSDLSFHFMTCLGSIIALIIKWVSLNVIRNKTNLRTCFIFPI